MPWMGSLPAWSIIVKLCRVLLVKPVPRPVTLSVALLSVMVSAAVASLS